MGMKQSLMARVRLVQAIFLIALAATSVNCSSSTADAVYATSDTACVCPEVDGNAPLPLNETPPAPAAECPAPPTVISSLIEAQARTAQIDADATRMELFDPSAITVITCGTGSAVPSDRAQSCTAVFVNGTFLLFDAGDGALRSMVDLGLPIADLSAVFLTHFHSDHIADLGEVISQSWIYGRRTLLPVYGGEAVDRVVCGFNLVYQLDDIYRTAHHGEEFFPPGVRAAQAHMIEDPGPEGAVVYDVDGVVVTAYTVDHSPIKPALGYRIDFAGRAVAISGDTIDTAGLRAMTRGADMLVGDVMNKAYVEDAECAFDRLGQERNAAIFRDIRSYHIDVEEVAYLAENAGVGILVLTHQVPVVNNAQVAQVYGGPISAIFGGELIVAVDGTRVVIPVD